MCNPIQFAVAFNSVDKIDTEVGIFTQGNNFKKIRNKNFRVACIINAGLIF